MQRMPNIHPGISLPALAFVAISMLMPGSVFAGPDCTAHPNHRSCTGGGGDEGGVIRTITQVGDNIYGDRIFSDGGGSYIHQVDMVSQGIGSPGNYFLKLTKGNQPAIRSMFLDFSDCVLGPCDPPSTNYPEEFTINFFTSDVNLRDLESTSESLAVNMSLKIEGNDGLWQLFFDPSDARCSHSTTILAIPRQVAEAWIFVADENHYACLAKIGNGGEFIFSGKYRMPFLLRVTRK